MNIAQCLVFIGSRLRVAFAGTTAIWGVPQGGGDPPARSAQTAAPEQTGRRRRGNGTYTAHGQVAVALGSAADEFERLWQQDKLPEVQDFLARAGGLPLPELVTVLCVDQRQRWSRGERV